MQILCLLKGFCVDIIYKNRFIMGGDSMDFSKIGSLSGYMKSLKLETKWKQKKDSGDFQSQSKKTELQRKNEVCSGRIM